MPDIPAQQQQQPAARLLEQQSKKFKIVGAQRTMYQGLWGIELSMRRILGVCYPKEKTQNGIFLKKFNLLINAYSHAKFHQIWIINEGVSGKRRCYTKGGRYPKEKTQNGIFF